MKISSYSISLTGKAIFPSIVSSFKIYECKSYVLSIHNLTGHLVFSRQLDVKEPPYSEPLVRWYMRGQVNTKEVNTSD